MNSKILITIDVEGHIPDIAKSQVESYLFNATLDMMVKATPFNIAVCIDIVDEEEE